MASSHPKAGAGDPCQEVRRITRILRLRLEDEGRAGLAGVPSAGRSGARPAPPGARAAGSGARPGPARDALLAASQRPARAGEGGDEPEACAAELLRNELAEQAAARAARAEAARPPAKPSDEAAKPVVVQETLSLCGSDVSDDADREAGLARIAEEVAACPRCPELVANRTRTVPGQGSPYAKLVFIGEGPGQDEDLQGLAFVGRAGQLLTKMIEAIGMTRDEVFIANILKCRPPGNRQPTPEEAANCRPYLARQLAILRPRIIVALGSTAAQHLLGTHDGITRLRGRFYSFEGAKLMPTFHPAYVLRNYTPDTRKKVYDDLLKAKAELVK